MQFNLTIIFSFDLDWCFQDMYMDFNIAILNLSWKLKAGIRS